MFLEKETTIYIEVYLLSKIVDLVKELNTSAAFELVKRCHLGPQTLKMHF